MRTPVKVIADIGNNLFELGALLRFCTPASADSRIPPYSSWVDDLDGHGSRMLKKASLAISAEWYMEDAPE